MPLLLPRRCLDYVSVLEESMVKGFPFEVPSDYAARPQLKVRVFLRGFRRYSHEGCAGGGGLCGTLSNCTPSPQIHLQTLAPLSTPPPLP